MLSKRASSFLSAESSRWPAKLEDAKVTSVMTWAHHQDPKAVIEPLYTVIGDEMKTVAQVRLPHRSQCERLRQTGGIAVLGAGPFMPSCLTAHRTPPQ